MNPYNMFQEFISKYDIDKRFFRWILKIPFN